MGSGADNAEADSKRHLEKKRSKDSKPVISNAADSVAGSTPSLDTTGSTPVVRAPETASSQIVDDTPVVADAPSPPTADAPVVTAPARSVTIDVQQPEVSTATPPHDPVAVVTTALSSAAGVRLNPFAGDAPTAPIESPVMWALAAAARRESLTSAPSLDRPADPEATVEPPVVAIAQTPPLAWLQQVPVVGALIVTPIVAFINQIPVISDVLHPLIGYPVQPGLPVGAPLPLDVKVISFDGTQIYTHFMPALGLAPGQTAPTILNGPALPLPGATNLNGALLDDVVTDAFGQVSIGTLRAAGYNVVTWDPRGEWNSGGVAELDSPDFEARDVSAIISWLATQPEVKLDDAATRDPRIGMVGASYGGGIQLVTAAVDHRVDAIVPTIAWHSLNSALYKGGAFKSSGGTLLSAALTLTLARVNPRIPPAIIYGDLTGMLAQGDQDLLTARGPGDLVKNITAPTLLIQGTADTTFSLQEADDNAQALIANGVPTKVVWFCGGHGLCLNNLLDLTDGALITQRTLEWLNRYVKGDPSVSTGPQFEWVDQRGQWLSSEVYPVPHGPPIVTSSGAGGVLPLIPYLGGSGVPVIPLGFKAINAVNLTVPAASTTTYIVGAPELTLTYSGTGSSRHVYAQLVDDTTGLVLGNAVTPIPVTLDGQTHTVSLSLEPVAQTLRPGQTVTLQLVASAGLYERIIPSLGVLNVSSMQLTLPTADAAAILSSSAAQLTVAA